MNESVLKIARGYAALVRLGLTVGLGVIALLLASAAVATPIWWLATQHTQLYTYLVVSFLAILVAASLVRRWRRSGSWSGRTLIAIGSILIGAWAITTSSLVLGIISVGVLATIGASKIGT